MEVAFIGMGVEVIFLKALEDFMTMFAVLFHVILVEEDVSQVDKDAYIEYVGEDVIHEALKTCWCISQTEGHNTVGCIYPSEPLNSSLIYYQCLFHSNPINKHQKQLK